MHSIPNKRNSKFQTLHFLVGNCHTPDAAYALLCSQREERETAIANVEASKLKSQAKVLKAQAKVESGDPIAKLEGQAKLAEMKAFEGMEKRNIEGAIDELEFINTLIAKLQPARKFSHLSDMDAHEAAQADEWCGELMSRAENNLLMGGQIPPAEFKTMRAHPHFTTRIMPYITQIKKAQHLAQIPEGKQDQFGNTFDAGPLNAILHKSNINPELQQLIESESSTLLQIEGKVETE